MDHSIYLLYTTINSLEEAEKLAHNAVVTGYAACVNITPRIKSIYLWQGQVETSDECALIFKTTKSCLPRLEQWLKENHPYTTPAILKGSIDSCPDFANYLHTSLGTVG